MREPEGHDPQCSVDSDCILVHKGCCARCPPTTVDDHIAVPRGVQNDAIKAQCPAGPVACMPCPRAVLDPLGPIPHSACVDRRCVVVDLRALPLTGCTKNSDCVPVGVGCCGAYSEDPLEYVGVDEDAGLDILQCVPAPPCVPPMPHATPISFCAKDGHCAVRGRERVAGVESATCFSRTQNLDQANDPAAVGCDCATQGEIACLEDSSGRRVALTCAEQGHWSVVAPADCPGI